VLLDSPPLVRSGVSLLFHTSQRANQLFFRSVFRPFSKVGNSEPHTTLFDYYSFYGSNGARTQTIGPCARMPQLALLVRGSVLFLLSCLSRESGVS